MARSRLCPAPMGYVSPESFRLYEALEAGCLPLVDTSAVRRAGDDEDLYPAHYVARFFAHLARDVASFTPPPYGAPEMTGFVYHVQDWASAAQTMRDELVNLPFLDRRQREMLESWADLKKALTFSVRRRLRDLDRGVLQS